MNAIKLSPVLAILLFGGCKTVDTDAPTSPDQALSQIHAAADEALKEITARIEVEAKRSYEDAAAEAGGGQAFQSYQWWLEKIQAEHQTALEEIAKAKGMTLDEVKAAAGSGDPPEWVGGIGTTLGMFGPYGQALAGLLAAGAGGFYGLRQRKALGAVVKANTRFMDDLKVTTPGDGSEAVDAILEKLLAIQKTIQEDSGVRDLVRVIVRKTRS